MLINFSVIFIYLLLSLLSPHFSLNNKILNFSKDSDKYSFIIIGHIYGDHNNSVFPSASILANINLINNKKPKFVILLGDIVQRSNKDEFDILKRSFLLRLNCPVFNAPGNHELTNRHLYEKYFGRTYFSFRVGSEYFIFLDSEINDGDIINDQLEFLLKEIEYCKKSSEVKNIFLLSHRLIWAINNSKFKDIIYLLNSLDAHKKESSNLQKIIIPKLKKMYNKNIYFISGDVGLNGKIHLLFEKEAHSSIAYLATGVGDNKNDTIIQVSINNNSKVTFLPISLTGKYLSSIEVYNVNYWIKNKIFYTHGKLTKILGILKHHYFWAGFSCAVGLISLLFALFQIRRKL